ncbi:hypothetical protein [Colwellia sp. Bg11-12]|jgi:hypothetical protein|uniref:hypothetical protein n=1 Tax=Colwellia sp. Bg11-12 TaxID=2759817 RepID=UPI0015F720FB|nr:hypothetical protein [Colwellia sp. Bg11-12]MBA6262824.1 hypothetical protein [Colwellia sp. Bg11-12]
MRNFKVSLLFILFTSASVLAQNDVFHQSPAIYGGWNCNVALDSLNKKSKGINNITAWVFGYTYGKKIQFKKGKSPASKTEYKDVLVPYLTEYCKKNRDSTFFHAMDSYVDFKLKQGEAVIGN